MSLERPIPTIRKAVTGAAEELARQESLEKPGPAHFKRALETIKMMRELKPDVIESYIKTLARGKDLTDKIGPERNSVLQGALKEIIARHGPEVQQELEAIHEPNPNSEAYKQEAAGIMRRAIDKWMGEIKQDPQVVAAFKDDEALLDEASGFFVDVVAEVATA